MATTNGVKANGAAADDNAAKHYDEPPPKFALPVDSEHKAKALNLLSLCRPHMLSFHLNWLGFFITFLAAYAAAPLIPIIRDSLNLEQHQANIAGKPSLAPITHFGSPAAWANAGPAIFFSLRFITHWFLAGARVFWRLVARCDV
jgi:hypothetical protein